MSDNSGLLMTNNTAAIKAISNYIYQTIVSIQQQHPEWINPKYKNIPWHHSKYESSLTNKLTKGLSCAATKEDLQLKAINYLQIILTPEFIDSDRYNALISQIDRFI
ncbi:MAG: hypothetical protein F6K48_30960, partial [Okeania sp. SIO3H1]|nr:hypothetical protein [Okeania sp. SIO3H1]